MIDPPPKPLDYAASPRRINHRRIIAVTLLVVVAFAAWRFGVLAMRKAQVLHRQRQALRYTAPADRVIYEGDLNAAKKLLDEHGGSYAPVVLNGGLSAAYMCEIQPSLEWHVVPRIVSAGSWPTLFLHERKTPDGRPFLIYVRYDPISACRADIITPATLRQPAVSSGSMARVPSAIGPAHPEMRLFAGQPDPADPSHFTIEYEKWGQTDVLDGWLNNYLQLTLAPRNPPKPPASQ